MTQDIRTIRIATQGPAGPAGPSGSANVHDAASQAEMLALAAGRGDIARRSDLNETFVLAADDPTVLANWKELLTPSAPVQSVAGLSGTIGASGLKTALAIAATDVSGLGALATLNAGSGLSSGGGTLSANVTSVAGRTGAVTLAQVDVSGLTTSDDVTLKSLTLAGGTITANAPVLNATRTWNASGVAFTALKLNITNTASSGSSLFADFQLGGSSKISLGRDGDVICSGGVTATASVATSSAMNWTNKFSASSPSAGILNLDGWSVHSFSRLQFGGATSSYPALGVSSTTLKAVLADGSADCGFQAGNLKATGSQIDFTGLPTSDPHVAGRLWSNSGVVTVSAG